MTEERITELWNASVCATGSGLYPEIITRFAELIAADVREACAKVCELGMDTSPDAELSEWSRAHNNACRTRAIAIILLGYEP
jgi:hypothetical protein